MTKIELINYIGVIDFIRFSSIKKIPLLNMIKRKYYRWHRCYIFCMGVARCKQVLCMCCNWKYL